MSVDFQSIAIVGLGLIGSSIARGVRQHIPGVKLIGVEADPEVADRASELGLCDTVGTDPALLAAADLVILCVPVGG